MKLEILFVCETCMIINRTRHTRGDIYLKYEWNSLTQAFNHIKDNPDHEVSAETEINL